ncbi:MAG TPA: hypothetical protein VGE68_07420 [Sphingomicrobium sp.]
MAWLLLLGAAVLLFWLASIGRKARQREALAKVRREFPRIARLRLVAACPGLDGVLGDQELRLLFDWILLQLYRRTRTSGLAELMRWSIEHGAAETTRLTADVSRDSVERLSAPVLQVIDGCQGREIAAVLVDQSLTEAGERIRLDSGKT